MTIKYAIIKNEMPASSTEAKYIGLAIPNGVRNRIELTTAALETEHFAKSTFDAVLDAAIAITCELCAEGRDVDWGFAKFQAKIHGSLPCEDSAFADGTASLAVNADATNATRAVLETLVPVKVSAADLAASIKFSNVMDVGTNAFGTIVGSTQFVMLGNGITLDSEGESAKALDKKTLEVKGTATVQSVSKGQRAYAKFDPQLAAGEYLLELTTKGLIGETTPRVFRKPFTAIALAPTGPTLTRIEDEEGHVGPTIDAGHEQDFLIGTNLAETTSVSMAGQKAVGTRYTLPCTIKAKTATKLTINIPTDEFDMEQNPVTLTVTTPAGTAEISAIMIV